jgi:hypothetical protein
MLLRYELWCAGLYSLLFAVDAFRLVTGRSGESERGYFLLAWMLHAGFFSVPRPSSSAWWRCAWWNELSAPVKCALTLIIAPMAPVVHVAVCVAAFDHDPPSKAKEPAVPPRCVREYISTAPLGPMELYRDPDRTDEMFVPFYYDAVCHALPCLCHALTVSLSPLATGHILLRLAYLVAVTAPVVCQAYDVKVVLWQLLLLVHDVSSACFVFVTVHLAAERQVRSPQASDIAAFMSSKIYVVAVSSTVCYATVHFLSAPTARDAVFITGGFAVVVGMVGVFAAVALRITGAASGSSVDVGWAPLLVCGLFELAKFSRIAFAVRRREPRRTDWLAHSVLRKLSPDGGDGHHADRLARAIKARRRDLPSARTKSSVTPQQQLMRLTTRTASAIAAVSTLISTAYLVTYAWIERDDLSLLEVALVFIAMTSLLAAVPLSGNAWHYHRYNSNVDGDGDGTYTEWPSLVEDVVGVTAEEALCEAVGNAVLPCDVVELLAGFIDTTAQRAALSLDECERIQKRFAW